MELIRRQLDVIHPFVDTIRLFRADGEPGKIYQPAKEEYKFRIIAGGWIGEGYSRQEIYRELDALIRLANNGYIDIAVVGSETMYRHDLTADALIGYINYVREGIDDKSIPVGTSDTPAAFLDNPGLVEASDVILCTIYPFFDNLPIEAAAQNMIETRNRVVNAAKDKQVIISETGWPTEGSPEGLAVPGVENAGKYFEDVYQWSRTNDAEVVFFSAFDEAWKIEGSNGDIGGHWGHFTADGKLGEAYLPVYRTISDIPDDVPEIPDDSGEKTGGGCDATGGQGVAGLSGVGLTGLFPALPRRNHKNLLKRKFF
jgi:exo-beta-1,3-glucanase (GH17 family)